MLSTFDVLLPDVKGTEGFFMHILFLIKTILDWAVYQEKVNNEFLWGVFSCIILVL